jgi:hypothetical protein
MDVAMMAVAERLAAQFDDQPSSTVIRGLSDCVDDHPEACAAFIAQAARVRVADERPEGVDT